MIRTCLALVPLLLQGAEPARDTDAVAAEYVKVNFQERDLDRSGALLSPKAFFVDPTGEVFGGELAQGVRGRDAIVALQRSWGIAESHFDIDQRFVAGEYAVHAGNYDFSYSNGAKFQDVPFVTLLRVSAGQVVERRDYGDYSQLVQTPAAEPDLERIARDYMDAYAGLRFEELEALQAEELFFQDPTATLIGAGQPFEGRTAARENFEQSFQGALAFEIDTPYSFFFHRQAVFAGTCRLAFPGTTFGLAVEKAELEFALLVALTVRDGKVVEHLDFADYDAFIQQLKAMKSA